MTSPIRSAHQYRLPQIHCSSPYSPAAALHHSTAAAAAAVRAADNSDMIVKAMAGPMSPKQVGIYRLLKAISVIAVMFKTKIMVQVLDFFYLN